MLINGTTAPAADRIIPGGDMSTVLCQSTRRLEHIKQRTSSAKYAAFKISRSDNLEFGGNILSNINIYGVSEDFENIQPVEVSYGRYLSDAEFDRGTNSVVIGYEVADKLFGSPEVAVGKEISTRGKKLHILGVMKKQGKQMIGGWNFDQSIVVPYRFARNMMNELRSDPVIMVQGQDNLTSKALKDDLTGTMRALHRLSPTKEADFALNDINDFSDAISDAFVGMNIGGAVIGGISLIVGLFGVANIMFVTVRERTGQIGLKKALGAKSRIILTEFLLESAFLCIIGGTDRADPGFSIDPVIKRCFEFSNIHFPL
ncbi:MAG: ABC transporter permease [Bacteroidota bacterium]